MPVPSTIGSLSTTASSNSPAGSENVFPDLDGHLRAGYSFTAQLHAGTNKPSWSASTRIPYFDASGNFATSATFFRDSSGNFGLGVALANTRLAVGGGNTNTGVYVENSAAAVSVGFFGNYASYIGVGTDNMAVVASYTTPLAFAVGGSEAMRLNTSRQLLLGTTSTAKPTGAFADAFFNNALVVGGIVEYQPDKIAFSAADYYVVNQSAVGVRLSNGSTAWAASSDERLKTDLQPIVSAAEKVASLRAVTGRYKTDEPGTRRAFLIAQDVQKVLPEAVDVQADDMGTLGVRYTEVIPLLVAAIGELQARIKALEA